MLYLVTKVRVYLADGNQTGSGSAEWDIWFTLDCDREGGSKGCWWVLLCVEAGTGASTHSCNKLMILQPRRKSACQGFGPK